MHRANLCQPAFRRKEPKINRRNEGIEKLFSAQAPNQHSQHVTDWAHIFFPPWLHSASVLPTPTLIPGIRPNFPLFSLAGCQECVQRGGRGRWYVPPTDGLSQVKSKILNYSEGGRLEREGGGGLWRANNSDHFAWPEEGLAWAQLADGCCRRPSLMLRPLPVPSDHFGYFQNFSANCTNASLVLTSLSHQRRLNHTGRDAPTCVGCDVTESREQQLPEAHRSV